MNHETHPASCKFCHLPVTLRIHPDALGMFDLKVWVALAACNRCADYHTRRIAVTAGIQAIATKWLAATLTLHGGDLEEAQAAARTGIERLTRQLADKAAGHYRAGFTWEADWVQQVIEHPQNATKMCAFYERQMWKDWNKRRKEVAA